MPYITAEGRGGPPQGGFFGGWLGRSYDPLFILKDPNAADFGMPELSPPPDVGRNRLEQRRASSQGSVAHPMVWAAISASGTSIDFRLGLSIS